MSIYPKPPAGYKPTPADEVQSGDYFDPEDDGLCEVCGGDGYIMAADGDGSDWGEDTYAGPMDAVIKCRHCKNGVRS